MIKKLFFSLFLTFFTLLFFANSSSFAIQCQQCPDRTSSGYSDPLLVDNPGCFQVNSNNYITYEQSPKVCMYSYGYSPNNACDIPINQTCSTGQECYKDHDVETGRGCVGAGTVACSRESATCWSDADCRTAASCSDYKCVTTNPPGYLYTRRECGLISQGGECRPPSVYNGPPPYQPFPEDMCVPAPPGISCEPDDPSACQPGVTRCNPETSECEPLPYDDSQTDINIDKGDYQPGTPFDVCKSGICSTPFGDIHTDLSGFIKDLLGIVLSLGGAIALILIIRAGYQMMLSQGNPEKIQTTREELTAAIIGLLFVIFSLVILQTIGVDILNLPGLGK